MPLSILIIISIIIISSIIIIRSNFGSCQLPLPIRYLEWLRLQPSPTSIISMTRSSTNAGPAGRRTYRRRRPQFDFRSRRYWGEVILRGGLRGWSAPPPDGHQTTDFLIPRTPTATFEVIAAVHTERFTSVMRPDGIWFNCWSAHSETARWVGCEWVRISSELRGDIAPV